MVVKSVKLILFDELSDLQPLSDANDWNDWDYITINISIGKILYTFVRNLPWTRIFGHEYGNSTGIITYLSYKYSCMSTLLQSSLSNWRVIHPTQLIWILANGATKLRFQDVRCKADDFLSNCLIFGDRFNFVSHRSLQECVMNWTPQHEKDLVFPFLRSPI